CFEAPRTPESYTLSLHDALPIYMVGALRSEPHEEDAPEAVCGGVGDDGDGGDVTRRGRGSMRRDHLGRVQSEPGQGGDGPLTDDAHLRGRRILAVSGPGGRLIAVRRLCLIGHALDTDGEHGRCASGGRRRDIRDVADHRPRGQGGLDEVLGSLPDSGLRGPTRRGWSHPSDPTGAKTPYPCGAALPVRRSRWTAVAPGTDSVPGATDAWFGAGRMTTSGLRSSRWRRPGRAPRPESSRQPVARRLRAACGGRSHDLPSRPRAGRHRS